MPPPPASAALAPAFIPDSAAPSLARSEEALLGQQRREAFLAVIAAAICIGFSAIFVRLSDVGPAAIGFWRLFFALGPMAVWALAERRHASRQRTPARSLPARLTVRQMVLVAGAGAFFAADLIFFHIAMRHTSTANALLLGNLAVVFVFVFGWLWLGERPTRGLVMAIALALPGAALIVGASAGSHGTVSGGAIPGVSVFGDSLALSAATCYAAYMLTLRALRRGGEGRAPALGGGTVALLSSAVGAVVCLTFALAAGEVIIPQSFKGLMALVGLGLIAHAAGQGLATFALGRLPAGVISVGLLLQIVVGTSLAAVLFGEIPSIGVVAGGSLVVAGVIAVRPARRPRRP
ncbi:DMT family transporter [Ancylobacter sp. MQZ15Z-1]|uniref:DMT family transporter n=1 Tax=Ancylobacter mangrovi TaxID=2972472 RepID=A0A9X2T2X0_9HYPH|nr:DMT family transporter [Ancylobacter mangrovi]MCS0496342.1 DMT family transporter [Ancylobacter mangrovi]